MDCEARRVNIAGREVNLTAKEFDVLELLDLSIRTRCTAERICSTLSGVMNIREMCVP